MRIRGIWFAAVCLLVPAAVMAQGGADPHSSPEALVEHLYDLVSFPAHELPDWEEVRATFIPEAVIILRTSREGSTTFSVDGFIDDWLLFIKRDNVKERGFTETIVNMKTFEYGDIANILVLEGRWLIASVLNEIPTADRPIPDVLKEDG